MTSKDPAAQSFKQKAREELIDFAMVSLYLAFFFCALVTYTMLLLRKHDIDSPNYAFAIINALIIGKVILIGELMHLGRRAETRPLYQAVLFKSVIFSLFVLAFHFLEEFIKRLIHGKPFGTVWHEIDPDELLARSIIVFCTFLPLFAVRELHVVLGPGNSTRCFSPPEPPPIRTSPPKTDQKHCCSAWRSSGSKFRGPTPGIRTSPGASPFNSRPKLRDPRPAQRNMINSQS